MASITSYQTGSGEKRYMIQVYQGLDPQTGKSKRVKRRGFKTKKQATLEASRLELAISQGDLKKENNILFKTVYEEWYQNWITTVEESTMVRAENIFINHILPAFGNKRMRTITVVDIQRAVNRWYKEVTQNYRRWFSFTKRVFDFALKRGYITTNPCPLVTMPKNKRRWDDEKEANFWDKAELIRFFSYIDPVEELEKYTLFRLLAISGIRRGECLALTWNDVNFSKPSIKINRTLTQGIGGKQIIQAPKTRGSKREVTLDQRTVFYLKKWRALQKREFLILGFNTLQKGQLVFPNTKNGYKSLNTPGKWLHSIIDVKERHFKPITIHGFRHTAASLMFEAGVSLKEVQTRLGHSSSKTTLDIYTHVTEVQDNEAVEKLANYLNL